MSGYLHIQVYLNHAEIGVLSEHIIFSYTEDSNLNKDIDSTLHKLLPSIFQAVIDDG